MQVIYNDTMKGALLDQLLKEKKRGEKGNGGKEERGEGGEEKERNHSRLQLIQRTDWQDPTGGCPRGQRGPGKLVALLG